MKLAQIEYRVEIPEKVDVELKDGLFTIKGPKGEVKRKFIYPKVAIVKDGNGKRQRSIRQKPI
jgi:ribosomal protein L6P/L9E